MEILWEIPLYSLFLIALYYWFTNKYHTTYENMRNENEKSFAGELEFNERLFFRKEQKRKR